MNKPGSGFVLLELLPALFVFMAALMAATRMLWLSGELDLAQDLQETRQRAVIPVWEAWKEDGGFVALAEKEHNEDWSINTFPDESWLPVGDMRAGSGVVILRRLLKANEGTDPYWEISYWIPGTDGRGIWKPYTSILAVDEIQRVKEGDD